MSTLELSRGKEGHNLLDRSTQQFHGGCGTGPSVTVDDTVVRTRFDASLAELMTGEVTLAPCRESVSLPTGSTHLSTSANALLAVDHVRLARAGLATTPRRSG